MRRSLVVSLLVTVGIAVVSFGASLGVGWHPKLGLDLAGGSEVVFGGPKHQKITSDQMDTTVNILRHRVDAAGASGASVNSQNGQVVVQLPGVKNPKALIDLIGTTAEMQFRPVLCIAGPYTKKSANPPLPSALPQACSSPQYAQTKENLNVTQGKATGNPGLDPALAAYPSTDFTYNDQHPSAYVLVPASASSGQAGLRYLLGPTGVPGSDVTSAQAVLNGSDWQVDLNFKSAGQWDTLAQQQFHALIAVDLDGQVISAPLTQPDSPSFTSFGGKVVINGSFTQDFAHTLALDLNAGSIPVPLHRVDLTTVSPSLGKSSLKAGLAAGIGGLLLVLIYAIFYYRALGIVVISGLLTTAALLWAIVAALGHTSMNLTLDLAGVTGVIVSIGITVDSYIVYFERLKDEVRGGRSVRTSVDRSFRGAFRTVLAADLVSLAAAVVLYILTVSTVRGFAFFLGLATLLDIGTTYFFTRPLVILLGRSAKVTGARFIGVARGLAAEAGAQP